MPVDEFGREIPGRSVLLDGPLPTPSRGGYDARSRRSDTDYREDHETALLHPLLPRHVREPRSSPHHRKAPHGPSRQGPPPISQPPASNLAGHPTAKRNHASYQYVEDPLLCHFLWKEEQKLEHASSTTTTDRPVAPSEPEVTDEADAIANAEAASLVAYEEYKKSYCLNYIRAFFNQHLDDSWFRYRYSPSVKLAFQRLHRTVLCQEARAMATLALEQPHDFVVSMRLGGGVKTGSSSGSSTDAVSDATPTGHLSTFQPSYAVLAGPANATSTELQAALHVTEIPPHVTDAQLCTALLLHVTANSVSSKKSHPKSKPDLLTLVPTSTMTSVGRRALQRDVIAIGTIGTIQEILRSLSNHHKRRSDGGAAQPRKDGVLPRKGDVSSNLEVLQTAFAMDVECSDPYGRVEYDADGRGAAPPDGLAVPLRKAVVLVTALAPHQATTARKCVTVTLSAALSSSERWGKDTEAALQLASALDQHQLVPVGSRLQDILASLPTTDDVLTDRLDVAVAYLRRVHCLSFYQGCAQAESVADVVTGKSPVSTIYLRLHQADDILSQAASPVKDTATDSVDTGETGTMNESNDAGPDQPDGLKDMLVQRLDDAIDRALSDWCDMSCDSASGGIKRITAQQDLEQAAASINDAESNVQQKWLSDHAIMDADGRARCSFVFCHKLFKDSTFLYQHLLKKHAEYLHAEQAKCHDAVMMAEWDSGTQPRPVPDILVDCGVRFGMVAATLTGGPEPNCVDPEPELWRREEERRERDAEMKARRAEIRSAAATAQHQEPYAVPRAPRAAFVDVDDMKEEKVELSFDTVAIPDTSVTTVLKKKKKRKLL